MKKPITLACVIAILFMFSSCEKEKFGNDSSVDGVRIITATFENDGVKTTLNSDGKTPEWTAGDVIRILSSTAYQDVTLTAGDIKDNKIEFTTTLQGVLYAVYPASATTMTSCNGSVDFTIPSTQDGSFASANICVAKSENDDNTNKDYLIFRNATAVLKIVTADDVVGVDVSTVNNIAGPVTALFTDNEISLSTGSLDGKSVSVVGKSAPSGNVFYLAAAPVSTGSTTATCYKVDKEGSTSKDSKELRKNVIYSMDLSSMTINTDSDLTGRKGMLNGHEYVIVKAKYDNTNYSYLKWATMNIGATAVAGAESYGDYFMWGATEIAYTDISDDNVVTLGSKPSSYTNSTWDATRGFAWTNSNLTDGVYSASNAKNVFTKYTANKNEYAKNGIADGKIILDPSDDAASRNWGSTWRMPTAGGYSEFSALRSATKWTWNSSSDNNGYYVTKSGEVLSADKSNAILFFPFTSCCFSDSRNLNNSYSYYWSSRLKESSPNEAFRFAFTSTKVDPANSSPRFYGCPVRPVSE